MATFLGLFLAHIALLYEAAGAVIVRHCYSAIDPAAQALAKLIAVPRSCTPIVGYAGIDFTGSTDRAALLCCATFGVLTIVTLQALRISFRIQCKSYRSVKRKC